MSTPTEPASGLNVASNRFRDPDEYGDMTAAELRVVREFLGLTTEWLAEHMGIAQRSFERWEKGLREVPNAVADALGEIERETDEYVLAMIAAAREHMPVLLTYRTDADFRTHQADAKYPASWHRRCCARVAWEVEDLQIDYWTPTEPASTEQG